MSAELAFSMLNWLHIKSNIAVNIAWTTTQTMQVVNLCAVFQYSDHFLMTRVSCYRDLGGGMFTASAK